MRAAPLTYPDDDRTALTRSVRSTTTKAGLVMRARTVLAAADRVAHAEIARRLSISRQTVVIWRGRYEADRIEGLFNQDRSGRPRTLDRDKVITTTLRPPPKNYGVTHWSSRLLADHLGIGHGTTTLFAALEIVTGKITGTCKPKYRQQEFLTFLKQIAKAYPDQDLHLVMDNYSTHKTAAVKDWLEDNLRIHRHFTPTSASGMNLVEVWFGIIERQAIHRVAFTSVSEVGREDPAVHHRLEPTLDSVRLAQDRRPDSDESGPSTNFKRAALVCRVTDSRR